MKTPRTYEMSARADAVVATRTRIAREAMALFLEHSFEEVTLARIAQASGVSHQTVLNHFDSKDGVVLAVTELFKAERLPTRYEAEPGDVAAAIHAVVGDYEGMGDANFRWAASGLAVLDAMLVDARKGHQAWLVHMFIDRLPTAPAARRRAIHALHAATDVYTWKLLRRDLRLSRKQTEKIMADLVVGILEGTKR